jgi:aspartate aminotransferase-like enzyme
MKRYDIPLVPGPVSVPEKYRAAYMEDYGSSDLEDEFFSLLAENQSLLKEILCTKGDAVIGLGEGMLALWGALKSVATKGDRVLVLSNGFFGSGFAGMAESVGAEAEILEAAPGKFFTKDEVAGAIKSYKPTLITAVHCETPSGLLNPIGDIADVIKESGALFCVDFVASAVGAPVLVDEWGIDLGLMGSQKCLSLLPDLSMLTVSGKAWKRAEEVGYSGYDALLPWKDALDIRYMPYTHSWQANAALNLALRDVLDEGPENIFKRHEECAAFCRESARAMGLEIYAADDSLASPTVTAIKVPKNMSWPELDKKLRARGMAAGGSYGPLAGKVFRIGHMGSQADMGLVKRGMEVLKEVLGKQGF